LVIWNAFFRWSGHSRRKDFRRPTESSPPNPSSARYLRRDWMADAEILQIRNEFLFCKGLQNSTPALVGQ